ncbi:MAG: hypothetical protein NTX22_11395 [Ignavibacteriales bacterium]|nr:hypothetical protein [Ignavibacteriales bacterium]
MKAEKYFWILLLFLSTVSSNVAQQFVDITKLNTPIATKVEREKFKADLIKGIEKNLSFNLNSENESKWEEIFWDIELVLYKTNLVQSSLKQGLITFKNRSYPFQRAVLEATYCLYPNEFVSEISSVAQSTKNPKLFAMAVNYLVRSKPSSSNKKHYFNLMEKKFPEWKMNPILFMLNTKRLSIKQSQPRPALIDILSSQFLKDETIIFSFQRKNRDYPGLVIIRKPDGKYVRTNDGNIFSVPQLARAISNLPGYITNGNTPQGILSIQGIDTSKSVFLGKTPNIQTILPFEGTVKQYFHNNVSDTNWIEQYKNLLPESWKNYPPIYEAYYAGKAGRSEIIVHGTTIDPEFYSGQSYYPQTPSLGCLCAKEIWSSVDGKCLISDQASVMNAFLSTGKKTGYLVVVENDDKNQPINLDELIMEVLNAEMK